ncbi:MAG: hypothetical protein COA78_22155 [Blastopirellula sp.]|nr:MAG: hypothetical protein COA78_22155 [Blastopirellula sp.]
MTKKETKKTGLELLREPFEAHHISKLPKPTRAQTDKVKANFKEGMRCGVCGGWHHKDVIHLDYVGHAALTDRLLDCDINWSWKPMANDTVGLPAMDTINGLWIELTVCGQTRLGYGSPDGKTGGNAIKECIGDALRNAAMRFGAALDLWHKGDLHIDEPEAQQSKPVDKPKQFKQSAKLDEIDANLLDIDNIKYFNGYVAELVKLKPTYTDSEYLSIKGKLSDKNKQLTEALNE